MGRQYAQIYPTAKKSYYTANEPVDWELSPEQNSIKAGSIYLSGKIEFRTAVSNYPTASPSGTALTADDEIYLDEYAGAHSFIRRITCDVASGNVENLDAYPRLVRMITESTMYGSDLINESDKQMALQCGDKNHARQIIKPWNTNDNAVPFCIRPLCALNSSNVDVPFRRTGVVKINIKLPSVQEILYGSDWNSSCGYWISDLQLHYEVVPDDGKDQPIIFQRFQYISHIIQSTNANVSSMMAGLSNAMCSSFILQSQENTYSDNNLKTAKLPDVTRVMFAFNDADQVRVAYPLENNEEIELNAQRALGVDGPNSLRLSRQHNANAENEGWLVGISFGQLRNLVRSKFDLNIQAGPNGPDNSTKKYRQHNYFRGITQLA